MFARGSRYEKQVPYTVKLGDGREVTAIRLPAPTTPVLAGYHRRRVGERLDHIAAVHLGDATAFWRLCDLSGSIVPDALAAHDLVGIPRKG